jgi:hypothetical protein
MPLTPEWANFFMAELAALAALTGFVVVAISINLTRILAYAGLANRAGEALIAPVGAITATSLVLIPEQPSWLLGSEVLVIGLVMVIAPIAFQAHSWRDRKDATAVERIARAMTSAGFSVAFVLGGALVTADARSGLYWIAAGDVACLIAVVFNAWVLMIEILR